jgi:hypothetical protein
VRSILRDDWVADVVPRKKRSDYRGPRKPVMLRLPEPLAEQLQNIAERCDMSTNDLLGVIVFAYLRRSGETR